MGCDAVPIPSSPAFVDVTEAVGLASESGNTWPDGTFELPEVMGGGVALIDFDADGDLDLYQARLPPPGNPQAPAPDRLFAQQADGRFQDVTESAGIDSPGYGQGVAAGDVDNDGFTDLYVANYGPDTFLRNRGDGTFYDATAEAGLGGDGWSVSATFFDFDSDGDLDLYVVRYLEFVPGTVCRSADGGQDYCGPANFDGLTDLLYRNQGDGTFREIAAEAGIDRAGRGLGVVAVDYTGDGRVDIFVANDGEANQLWVHQADGTFVDEALVRGLAVNGSGEPEASMGVAVGDADGDQRLDLFMTHLRSETNTLYRSNDAMVYRDVSGSSGFGSVDLRFTGFGCVFVDFDHDGDLDLAIANGGVKRGLPDPNSLLGGFWGQFAQPDLLLVNDGTGRFEDGVAAGGDFTGDVWVSRGLASGDIDGDGDPDLALGHVAGIRIYRNDSGTNAGHWLWVRARDRNRDALGALITAKTDGGEQLRSLLAGSSYASSNEPAVHFGLGPQTAVEWLEVDWPDGTRERFDVDGVDRTVTLTHGTGSQLQ